MTDYAADIGKRIHDGRLVIFDQSLGDPEMNEQAAARIMWQIFLPTKGLRQSDKRKETGELKKPPPVIIYVEEAHTLLPKGSELM